MWCFLVPYCATVLWSRIFCGTRASHSPIRGQLAPCFNPESTAPYEPKSSKLTDLAGVTCSLLRVVQWALRPHDSRCRLGRFAAIAAGGRAEKRPFLNSNALYIKVALVT